MIKKLRHGQRGITGLETAIILIAFVVVSSVFAYTVLSAGIFSSEKAKEVVNASMKEVRSSLVMRGNMLAYMTPVDIDGDPATTADQVNAVTKFDIVVGVALQGLPIDLTPPHQLNATNGNLEASGLSNTLVVNYLDVNQVITDVAWTVTFIGDNDGDFSLESTEKAIIHVWLSDYKYDAISGLYYALGAGVSDPFIDTEASLLRNYSAFAIEISPVLGSTLQTEKVTPQSLKSVMNLH